ncbi:heme-binding beta-barrel domain-containing protein [Brachybacterium sp. FME24]|uniref:FABP family protein n=1 Tax=Brachybacterium sp. FME24 TaxID=2742605 RepID=UPI0018682670|nr:heme-binding beta-barrel domain-containing protein [Brachybacterium sp. FME24]
MPISLDPSLPESLYPLAWLVGTWQGEGAVHRPGDAEAPDRRIEQQLVCTAREDGTLGWRSTIHEIDDPAPLPPTSAFARDDTPEPAPAGTGERTLLMREDGIWTIGDPLPGQDVAAAQAAKPGDPAGFVSYALEAHFERRDGADENWTGEVRGPRVQLALGSADGGAAISGTRMFGYISGRLMWLWEQRVPGASNESADPQGSPMTPYISLELHRV